MANRETISKKVSKKEARKLVYDRLAIALADLKTGIKDKKFESNLLKASKLFAVDIVKAAAKNDKAEKKEKAIKVKAEQKPALQPAI